VFLKVELKLMCWLVVFNVMNTPDPKSMPLSTFATIPKTMRFPEPIAYQLDLISEQMGTTSGKFLNDLLEEILPAFAGNSTRVDLRSLKVYQFLQENKMLRKVDQETRSRRSVGHRILRRQRGIEHPTLPNSS
jgi:hypothetical protein